MHKIRFFSVLAMILLSITSLNSVKAANNYLNQPKKRVLTNCNVIDCTGTKPMKGMTVVIEGNQIKQIYQGAYKGNTDEKGVEVVDLNGAYVLPGLWNVHMHMAALLPDPNNIESRESLVSNSIRAGLDAMDGLRSGFTGIRTVGERDYIDVDWRNTFDEGFFLGPRIVACGVPVSPTAGHRGNVANGYDGVPEVRKAVRDRVVKGVNYIKIMGDEFLDDELQTVIETAHSLGIPITAHISEPAAYNAVSKGIDCIEHGYNITDRTLELMAEKGTYYVPTVICNLSAKYITERDERLEKLGYSKDEKIAQARTLIAYADERSQAFADHQKRALVKAFELGVKVCTGSDSNPIGEIGLLEIEQFVLFGVSEMDALIAATKNPAEMCGAGEQLGTIEEGKLADILVVADNPLKNISNLRKVKMVLKDGVKVDLNHNEGTLRIWDYYFTQAQQKGFTAAANKAAGFVK